MPIETRQQYLERVVKEQAEEIEHLKKRLSTFVARTYEENWVSDVTDEIEIPANYPVGLKIVGFQAAHR